MRPGEHEKLYVVSGPEAQQGRSSSQTHPSAHGAWSPTAGGISEMQVLEDALARDGAVKERWHGAASHGRATVNVGGDDCGCRGESSEQYHDQYREDADERDEQNVEREELWSEISKQVGEGD
mmetsp:Transcript_82122/g.264946  ORF Transcript_82122/g.264946 Transcript_82122/m.264946 type:complete len:123 (+) Transcript_82122:182-550(+)